MAVILTCTHSWYPYAMICDHMVTNHLRAPYDSTAPVRCPAGGKKNRTILYHFLDIVRCPVNFRYYLKFHSARTAFGRVLILFDIYIVRFQRRPAGHRAMSEKRQELKKIA